MELKDTVELMLSKDYKERFTAEIQQLQIRMDKLAIMLKKHDEGTLEFEPTCPISVLEAQLKTMHAYYNLLFARAELEKIELKVEA